MNFVTTIVKNIQDTVNGQPQRNPYRQAISSALKSVAAAHPDYAGTGFDEDLIDNEAASLMQAFLDGGTLPTVTALTEAWATQFSFSVDDAEQAIANITPMVQDFLYVLESEYELISNDAMLNAAATTPAFNTKSAPETPIQAAI